MKRSALSRLAGGCLAAAVALTLAAPSDAAPKGPAFAAPVKITPLGAGGYEPGVYSDRYGNIYATAHKENAELAISPDSRSSTKTRSMSWTWYSSDQAKTWKNLPGPAGLDVQNHTFGDEGDMATDDAGNLYFVDTNVTDISFTSWHASGLGTIAFKSHLPTVGFGQPTDDRPWVAAHNDGHVFYFGNEGDQNYVLGHSGEQYGTGTGPGRYTVYSSYDGGKTWDHIGTSLKDSGWCRPAAAPHSAYVYAFCGNDNGKLYSFVSRDDGKTWQRYDVGSYTPGPGGWASFPSIQVLPDGTLWGMYLNPTDFKSGTPTHAQFMAYRSTDHGHHWKAFDLSPSGRQSTWQYEYSSLALTRDGRHLGYAVYGRPTPNDAWKIYATTFRLGQKPTLTSLDDANPVAKAGTPEALGDFLMSAFDPAGHLTVTWTRSVIPLNQDDPAGTGEGHRNLFRDIFSARSK